MNETDLAYAAGFFDGEGDCRIRQVRNSAGNYGSRVDARITQNDREVLDWLRSEFGGSVYLKRDNRTTNQNHAWMLSYRQARKFLTAIEPYTRVKRDKISTVLDECGRLTS